MRRRRHSKAEREELQTLAKVIVETCFLNSGLEDLHAGIAPDSATGDYSDVRVVSPYGEIAWSRLSRIYDDEMKALMIEVVDRTYTFLLYSEELASLGTARRWDKPQVNLDLLRTVRRRRKLARREGRSGSGED